MNGVERIGFAVVDGAIRGKYEIERDSRETSITISDPYHCDMVDIEVEFVPAVIAALRRFAERSAGTRKEASE